jgi:endonuclease YncB( thermonuclease family)
MIISKGVDGMNKMLMTFALLTISTVSHIFALDGRVVGVSDGDTYTILTQEKQQVKVRLHGIDCPESHQAFGSKAKQFASSLVFSKDVSVEIVDKDKYGRTVGIVTTNDGLNVNHAMLEFGFAWWYRQYAPEDTVLKNLEEFARSKKIGLWADPNPIPPWEFRHPTTQKSASTSKNESRSDDPPVRSEIVSFNTNSLKYHCRSCQWAIKCTRNCIDMDINEAKRRGVPCKVCGGSCR